MPLVQIGPFKVHSPTASQQASVQAVVDNCTFDYDLLDGDIDLYFTRPPKFNLDGKTSQAWGQQYAAARRVEIWPALTGVQTRYTIAHELGHFVAHDLLNATTKSLLINGYLYKKRTDLSWREGHYTIKASESFAHQFAVKLYAGPSADWTDVLSGGKPNKNGLYRRYFKDAELGAVRSIVEGSLGDGDDTDDTDGPHPGFIEFPITKDLARRVKVNAKKTIREGAGAEKHLPLGFIGGASIPDYIYTALMQADFDWPDDIESIDSAFLELTVSADPTTHISASGEKSVLMGARVLETWTEGSAGEGDWDGADWRDPDRATDLVKLGTVGSQLVGSRLQFDVLSFIAQWAPKTLKITGHGPGKAKDNFGLFLRTSAQDKLIQATEFASSEADDEDDRPTFYITYTTKDLPPIGEVIAPIGAVPSTVFEFEGSYADPQGEDSMGAFEMQVRKVSGGTAVWSPPVEIANANSQANDRFRKSSAAAPANTWQTGVDYEWRHRVQGATNKKWSDWTSWEEFSITAAAPTVTATNLGSKATLDAVYFGGPFTDPEGVVTPETTAPLGFPRMTMWWPYWKSRSLASVQAVIAEMVAMNITGVILMGKDWGGAGTELPADVEDKLDAFIAAGVTPYVGLWMAKFDNDDTTAALAAWAAGNGKWAGAVIDAEAGWKDEHAENPAQSTSDLTDFIADLRTAGCGLIALSSYGVPSFHRGMDWDLWDGLVDLFLPQIYYSGENGDDAGDTDRILDRAFNSIANEGITMPYVPTVNAWGISANPVNRREYASRALDEKGAISWWRYPIRNTEVRDVLREITAAPGSITTYRIVNVRLQLRTENEGDPAWDGDTGFLWDTGEQPITAVERTSGSIKRLYSGTALPAGSYTYRLQVQNTVGAWSDWDYGTLTLTVGYQPDPGAYEFLSSYGRQKMQRRIVIRDMDAERGPGTIKAVITDAANIGASIVANDIGEFYFTIPTTHPQASEIEPLQRHYALEFYRAGAWRPVFEGVITDMDADENEVVFYGLDYMGLLSKSIETSFYDWDDPEAEIGSGGAKYVDETISYVIKDQLERGQTETDSPLGFIDVEAQGSSTLMESINEKVSIHAEFRERLGFILGLIQSAKQGTGKRSRLWVEHAADGSYRWRYKNNAGSDRDNLRLKYGELVQGFRLVLLGNWAAKVYGAGRITNEVKLRFATADAPGIDTSVWGNVQLAAVWQDLIDENDLKRRVKQLAMEMGKFGKSVALGLRVSGLEPLDGFDLMDNIPVEIIRGAVDTTRYGSGYWTILGCEYRLHPDGHDELTLAIKPREDSTPPDEDLIPSLPVSTAPEWTRLGLVGANLVANTSARIREDGTSSPLVTVEWDAITEEGFGSWAVQVARNGTGDFTEAPIYSTVEPKIEIEDLASAQDYSVRVGAFDTSGNFSEFSAHVVVTAASDVTAPTVPASVTLLPSIRSLLLSWPNSPEADLSHYEVQWKKSVDISWESRLTKATVGVITGLDFEAYDVRVRAIDLTGNVSAWSPTATDTPLPVDTVDVADDAITAAKINVGQLSAISADVGVLTAGTIRDEDSFFVIDLDNARLIVNDGNRDRVVLGDLGGGDFGLEITDRFGVSSVAGEGFSGSWADYIRLGLYNARFVNVTVGVLDVGLTDDLPYWTIAKTVGNPVATGLAGGGVKVTFDAINDELRLSSNWVPVLPGAAMETGFAFLLNHAAGTLNILGRIYWFKADGSASATTFSTFDSLSLSASVGSLLWSLNSLVVPTDAVFGQFVLIAAEVTTHNAANSVTFYATKFTSATVAVPGGLRIGDGGAIAVSSLAAGTYNDYDPGGLGTDNTIFVQLQANGDSTFTGIVKPVRVTRHLLTIYNQSSTTVLTFTHADAASADGNRFMLPNLANLVLRPRGSVTFRYESLIGYWLVHALANGSGGAPTAADYLVGTAHADLSSEIVVGTTPGGELGGTWAAPTVDATHSGSAHHTRAHNHSDAADGLSLSPTLIVTSAEITAGGAFTASEIIQFIGLIGPTISGNQNNYNPTGFDTCSIVWLNLSGTGRTITGFAASANFINGRMFWIASTNVNDKITLAHNSASSSSGNRIACSGAANVTVYCALILYRDVTGSDANPFRVLLTTP